MSDSVFRIATREAIREILLEHAQQGRFGILFSEPELATASDRIVDLMETALTLRSGVQERLERAMPDPQRTPTLSQRGSDEFGGRGPAFPRTRNAAEIYEQPLPKSKESTLESVAPSFDFKLARRQRVTLSEAERERLGGR